MAKQQIHRKLCKRYNYPNNAHALTFSCYKYMKLIMTERTCKNLAFAVINACKKQDFFVIAYVFMPTHVHLLVGTERKEYSISEFMKSVKQSVARRELDYYRKNQPDKMKSFATGQKYGPYRFWQDGGGYDRNIVKADTLRNSIKYIHRNPVRAELAEAILDWKWSSAGDWMEDKPGFIPIDKSWL